MSVAKFIQQSVGLRILSNHNCFRVVFRKRFVVVLVFVISIFFWAEYS